MKKCTNCGMDCEDNEMFCRNCGAQFIVNEENFGQNFDPNNYRANEIYDEFDHTSEFDPKDISDNKVMAIICYILGVFGIIIALLGSHDSPYTAFHVRQSLKITVVTVLMWAIAALTCWLFFIPVIAAGIMTIVFAVIEIICFVQVCKGEAKEPAIIRSLKFLK